MKTLKCLTAVLLGGLIAVAGCCWPVLSGGKQEQSKKETKKEPDKPTAPKKGEELPVRKPILE